MFTVTTYLIYLAVSIGLTIWVARTLHANGRIFLVDAFHGNERLADSVNHLLVVGFYLVNIGYVSLALQYGAKPFDAASSIEVVSWKIGLVLLILGAMHFGNLAVFHKLRANSVEIIPSDSARLARPARGAGDDRHTGPNDPAE
jgi:hypothetical protein